MAGNYKVVTDYTANVSENSNVKVFVRARPVPKRDIPEGEEDPDKKLFEMPADDNKRITVGSLKEGVGDRAFQFDQIFGTESSQGEIFGTICQEQVDHCLKGYNSCCFAYGQTGSGKTYSMFGEGAADIRGIIPRAMEYLFSRVHEVMGRKEVAILVSFVEIYCDKIRDLARAAQINQLYSSSPGRRGSARFERPSAEVMTSELYQQDLSKKAHTFDRGGERSQSQLGGQAPQDMHQGKDKDAAKDPASEYHSMDMEIHEDQYGNVYIKDALQLPASTVEEVMDIINQGLKVRATHATKMNDVSSRSHTVFTVNVLQRDRSSGEAIQGKLNLVDLAGSERLKKSESSGIRLKEALHINSSLTALGKVVMSLDPNANQSHIPYRDSKLTRLLQNSLGGNCYTSLLATIQPCMEHIEECVSTLQFANRCRVVQNQPRVTYVTSEGDEKDKKIKQLTEEVEKLKRKGGGIANLLGFMDSQDSAADGDLPDDVRARKAQMKQAQITEMMNDFLYDTLVELGLNPTRDADGRLQLPNGKVVGMQAPGSEGGETGPGGGVPHQPAVNPMLMSGALKGASKEVQAVVAQLEEERLAIKHRLKTLKADSETAQAALRQQVSVLEKRLKSEVGEAHATSRMLEAELSKQQEVVDSTRRKLGDAHKDQIGAILDRNMEILRDMQQKLKEAAQKRLGPRLVGTEGHSALEGILDAAPATSPAKVQADALRALEMSKSAEVANLRQQYEYWLETQAEEARSFVEDFNKYRAQQRKLAAEAEAELIRLYQHAGAQERIVEGMASGAYPLRQAGGRATPVIPPSHWPSNPRLLAAVEYKHRDLARLAPRLHSSKGGREVKDSSVEESLMAWGIGPDGPPLLLPENLSATRRALVRREIRVRRRTALEAQAKSMGLPVDLPEDENRERPGTSSGQRRRRSDLSGAHQPSGQHLYQGNAASALRQGPSGRGTRPRPQSASALGSRQRQGHVAYGDGDTTAAWGRQQMQRMARTQDEESDSEGEGEMGAMAQNPPHTAEVEVGEGSKGSGSNGGESVVPTGMSCRDFLALEIGTALERMGGTGVGLAVGADPEGKLTQLQSFLENQLPDKVERWVTAELKASDTVKYMASLASKLTQKEEQMQDKVKAFNELKISYESLRRQYEKVPEKKKNRPSSAARMRTSSGEYRQ